MVRRRGPVAAILCAAALAGSARAGGEPRTFPRVDWTVHGTWAPRPRLPLRGIAFPVEGGEALLLDLDGNGRMQPWTDGWVRPGSRILLPLTPLLPLGDATYRWEGARVASVAVRVEPLPPDALPLRRGIEVLNRWREAAGLPLVAFDPAASAAVRAHLAYLDRHFAGGAMPHSPHQEERGREGYTPEGEEAGSGSCICAGSPESADAMLAHLIDGVFGQVYHRIPLLDPGTETAGIGFGTEWACLYPRPGGLAGRARGFHPVRFPAPGQEGVPQRFGGQEFPSPLPADLSWDRAGFPVTLTFEEATSLSGVTARLVRVLDAGDGPEVPCVVSWPGNSVHPGSPDNLRTIALVPREPLARDARYRVEISASGGTPVAERWEFRTHPDDLASP